MKDIKLLLIHGTLWLLLIAAILFGMFCWLRGYTMHNETYRVPDFSGLVEEEAAELARTNRMRYEIIDSVYMNRVKPGAVVYQQPAAGAFVKQNRNIFLTINALHVEMVTMPNLLGVSLRQAASLLQIYGLRLGQFTYEPDIAHNNVLRQLYKGHPVATNYKIPKGSVIDLVVGLGTGLDETTVPHLTGATEAQVRDSLVLHSLNLGTLAFDATVQTPEDTLAARAYRQTPSFGPNAAANVLPVGSRVSVWFTTDNDKVEQELRAEEACLQPAEEAVPSLVAPVEEEF